LDEGGGEMPEAVKMEAAFLMPNAGFTFIGPIGEVTAFLILCTYL
jgi:hypothetical protein